MSVFTVTEKRAFLEAAITQSVASGDEPTNALSELSALTHLERTKRLGAYEEDALDRLISAHIREASKRITRHLEILVPAPALQSV